MRWWLDCAEYLLGRGKLLLFLIALIMLTRVVFASALHEPPRRAPASAWRNW